MTCPAAAKSNLRLKSEADTRRGVPRRARGRFALLCCMVRQGPDRRAVSTSMADIPLLVSNFYRHVWTKAAQGRRLTLLSKAHAGAARPVRESGAGAVPHSGAALSELRVDSATGGAWRIRVTYPIQGLRLRCGRGRRGRRC